MRMWIFERLSHAGIEGQAEFLSYAVVFAFIAVFCVLLWILARLAAVAAARAMSRRTKSNWDDEFFKNRVFHRASAVAVPIALLSLAGQVAPYDGVLVKLGNFIAVLVVVFTVVAVLRAIGEIYSMYEISKTRPIRGLIQVTQIAAYILGGIVAAAILAGQSPMVLLGGIGAMTAVTSLIFKDAIVGFVAGIQLTGNDMVRIGDWIEMPQCSANGDVIDISLTTVKVENFDKTITSIPAYSLVSDAFINWRGMISAGGRRIKRSITINAEDVRFCDEQMLERLSKIGLLREYLAEKTAEIARHNESLGDKADKVDRRALTNLGTFRAYIVEYLVHHPRINHDMLCIVRQLAPDENGIPLELYAFAATTAWREYEGIQADIFDHLYAVAREFGLRIFQRPSSDDVRRSAVCDE